MNKKIEAADRIEAIAQRVVGRELPLNEGVRAAAAVVDDYEARAEKFAVRWGAQEPSARARSDREGLVNEIETRREHAGQFSSPTSDFYERLTDLLSARET